MSVSLRRQLLARQHGLCILCGERCVRPTIEHVVPVAHGGAGGDNLAVSCAACNGARGVRPLTPEQKERLRAALARGDEVQAGACGICPDGEPCVHRLGA